MADQMLVSVRGEAERTVAPDYVTLHCGLRTIGSSKVDALGQLRQVQQALVGVLAQLGGTPLTVQSRRAPLTWSLGSVNTYDENDFDRDTGHHGPTGRIVAEATLMVTSRSLARLNDLGDALASVRNAHVGGIGWHVDTDNEQWRAVRTDAIEAAIAKGRDYAAALGGTVRSVEQIADAGLLSSGPGDPYVRHGAVVQAAAASLGYEDGAGPSLDPVPQVIRAVVEARLIAEVEPLESD